MTTCLVSTKHPSYNPRVVKEADVLAEAGHDVTVVTVCNHAEMAALDAELMQGRPWRLRTVNCRRRGGGRGESLRWLWQVLRQRFCQRLCCRWTSPWMVERAQGRETPELRRLACATPADLYIAHHAEALPAAAAAAAHRGARLAFDAEDFHSGMDDRRVPESVWRGHAALDGAVAAILDWHAALPELPEQARIESIESRYLPRCAYLTAASDGIGMAYQRKYSLARRPTTVLNVFPPDPRLCLPAAGSAPHPERHNAPTAQRPNGPSPIRLYWYSQVIGPGRGLEEAVAALALLPEHAELHLRGRLLPGFDQEIRRRAETDGTLARLHFHPPCPPDELISRAAEFDIGLALEPGKDVNNCIAVSNKLFVYLQASLAVVASDTPAQVAIMEQAPGVGGVCRAGDARDLARAVLSLCASPDRLAVAKAASRRLAAERFTWQRESQALLALANS